MEKDLLCLPCRHGIYKLWKSVFEEFIAMSAGPEKGLIKRFLQAWFNTDVSKYATIIDDQFVMNSISKDRDILNFAKGGDVIQQTRDNYKEFLQRVVIFKGGHKAESISHFDSLAIFTLPDSRCMAKVIYW